MKEKKISRRSIITSGSEATVSLISSTPVIKNEVPGLVIKQNNMPAGGGDEICFLNALDMVSLIKKKKISSREVMQAHLAQIKKVNPIITSRTVPPPIAVMKAMTKIPKKSSFFSIAAITPDMLKAAVPKISISVKISVFMISF